jgi:hypothetical protein
VPEALSDWERFVAHVMRELHRNLITKEFARSAADGLIVLESLYALYQDFH